MDLLIVTIVLLIALIFFIKTYSNMRKHTAAMNALVSKATYDRLPESSQREVENRAISILEQGWRFSREGASECLKRMTERERYGFFALAMLELNIKPVSDRWRWQIVRNPYLALIKANRQIKVAKHGLQCEGIEVNLND